MSPAKKTTRKTKAKKAPARRKAASKKATPPKARATKKKAAAPAGPAKTKKKAATAEKTKTAEVAPQEKRAKTKAARKAVVPPPSPPPDAHPKLGVKHTCFQCGAKFYDLFRPEPLCPKCGADQREAPKVETKRKPAAAPKRARKRAMAPLLDEEDEEPVFDELDESVLALEPAGAELDDPAAETEDESDL
jgi:uncharacterized protein (TIGR02300 family)